MAAFPKKRLRSSFRAAEAVAATVATGVFVHISHAVRIQSEGITPSYVQQLESLNPVLWGEQPPSCGDTELRKPCIQRAYTRSGIFMTAGVGESL